MFLFSHLSVSAGITDLKLSTAQIFDVQWNISGGKLNASGFNYIYSSVNYATQTNSAARWTAAQTADAAANGRYIGFFNSSTNPGTYGMAVFNSDGSTYKIINNTGSFRTLADGAIFYNGNGMWGTLITTKQGYSLGQSGSFTITQDYPNNTQLEAYTPPSSTPLTAGQTAAPPPPPPPSYGVNFTRVTSFEWKKYTAGSQPVSGEYAHEAFDDNNSKWFGLRSQGAWVVVQFVDNSQQYSATRAVQKIQFRTANDAAGRDPNGYRIWGSADGVNWILIKEEAITLPAGRNTDSQVYELNNVTAYSYYKVEFTGVKDGGDAFQINEIRLIYDVDDPQGTQAGGGIYVQPTPVYGPSGASTIQQTLRTNALNENPYGHNAVVGITGDDNIVTIQQIGTGGQYASVDIQGNINIVSVEQTSTNGSRHYLNTAIIGNNNDLTLKQSGANKTQFVFVGGNDNNIATNQKGTGSHFLNLDVTGDNHTVGIVQEGAGNHSANVVLGGSQPWNFQLNQNSSTSQNYTLPHGMSDGSAVSGTCAAIGGCNLIVNQQ